MSRRNRGTLPGGCHLDCRLQRLPHPLRLARLTQGLQPQAPIALLGLRAPYTATQSINRGAGDWGHPHHFGLSQHCIVPSIVGRKRHLGKHCRWRLKQQHCPAHAPDARTGCICGL